MSLVGTQDSALDLVEDQQQVALVAAIAQRQQEGRRLRTDTALALHRLDQETGGVVVDQVERGIDVVEGRIGKAGQQRIEDLAHLLLIGRRYSAATAAEEGLVEG